MAETVFIDGKTYRVDTEKQQRMASAALSAAGINSVVIHRDGEPTERLLLADSNVDPVENGTARDKHGACGALVAGHADSIMDGKTSDYPSWKARHARAWRYPRKGGERAVKLALEAYAAYADDYYDSFRSELGGDVYFGEHALEMLRAINASLTMGFKSDLDSGAVHRLVRELAAMSGVDPEAL